MTAAQSRRARAALLEQLTAAYRASHDHTAAEAGWPNAIRALRAAAEQARVLARVAGQRDRDAWDGIARRIEEDAVADARPALALLGYPIAARQAFYMWECSCGYAGPNARRLISHIATWSVRLHRPGEEHRGADANRQLMAGESGSEGE